MINESMKNVFTGNNPVEAQVAAGYLQAQGVKAEVRRDQLWSVAVEVWSTPGVLPSVWVPESQVVLAKQLLADRDQSQPIDDWQCDGCGRVNEGHFDLCWNCEKPRS